MLRLFSDASFSNVKRVVNSDDSIKVEGDLNTVVMYTLFMRRKSKEVLVYKRPESYYYENFRNRISIGFGGSIEVEDLVRDDVGDIAKMESILESGLREVEEEVIYEGDRFGIKDLSYIGIIDDTVMALVSIIVVDDNLNIRAAEPENIHVGWMGHDELAANYGNMEPWTRDIFKGFLKHYYHNVSTESSKEEWRKIPGYSGYLASSSGAIKNLNTGRISEGGNAGRYLKVSVYPDRSSKPHLEYLHILICKAFHGLPKENQVVVHKNNIRHDCRASNLKWDTQSNNIQNAYDDGLVKGKGSNVK